MNKIYNNNKFQKFPVTKAWDSFFFKFQTSPSFFVTESGVVSANDHFVDSRFINYLRSQYGARFYKIRINNLGSRWSTYIAKTNKQTDFDSYSFPNQIVFTLDPRIDIKTWQHGLKKFFLENVVGSSRFEEWGLNCLELVEFLYFNIKNLKINSYVDYNDKEKNFKGVESCDIEMLLVLRSIVGADLGERFDKNIIDRECNERFSITPLTEPEAVVFYKDLISYFPELYRRKCDLPFLDFQNVRQYLHGWHWFRNYSSIDKKIPSLDEIEPYYSKILGIVKDNWDRDTSTYREWGGGLSTDFIKNFFAYSSYSTILLLEDHLFLDEKDFYANYKILDSNLYHRHSEILGLNVDSTYDSPAVLFNLIKTYCILKKIRLVDNTLYSLQNDSFYRYIGSLSWFKNNIGLVMEELAEEFPISFSVLDQPLLLSKQLNNVMQLIEVDHRLIFKT